MKHHGREVATQVFDRKRDAETWEEDQKRRLRMGEWFDPRGGRVALSVVAVDWLESRHSIKRNSPAFEVGAWTRHIEPRLGKVPVASISSADVSTWVGRLVQEGMAPSTAARYLGVFRRLLAFAVQDGRVSVNAAAAVRPPTAGHMKREGQYLTREEVEALAAACAAPYADVVWVLALAGLRWRELAGLTVGDRVKVPGEGLRLQRAVMSSKDNGGLFEDSLKSKRSRTVPLVADLVPIVDRWSTDKAVDAWLFATPKGGPLSEPHWKRSVGWAKAIRVIGRPNAPSPRPAPHLCLPVAGGRC